MVMFLCDFNMLDVSVFGDKYGIVLGYMIESSCYFEVIGCVLVKWNCVIFYDGGIFYLGDICWGVGVIVYQVVLGWLIINVFFKSCWF